MKRILAALISVCILTGLIVAVAAVVQPGATAYAAPLTQGGIRLENLLKREQIILVDQQQRLDLSNQAITAAQTWISHLQEQGKDVTALQAAHSAFQSSLAQAQGSVNTAQSTLNTHNGFGANGKVTDNAQALQTLIQAGRAERQFHLTITQATIDFRQAVQHYRQANP
jgi:hypothetical protein